MASKGQILGSIFAGLGQAAQNFAQPLLDYNKIAMLYGTKNPKVKIGDKEYTQDELSFYLRLIGNLSKPKSQLGLSAGSPVQPFMQNLGLTFTPLGGGGGGGGFNLGDFPSMFNKD